MARLFGQTAGGLSATGDGDLNNYYDHVAAIQEADFRPDLELLDRLLVRSALGDYPEDISWTWNPLYQESGTELAQQDLATTQAESARLQDGILQRSQIMRRLKQEGRYAITDDQIEDAEREEMGEFDQSGEHGEGDSLSDDPAPAGKIDPKDSLNGAQVTAILEIISRVTSGEIKKSTAVKIMANAFPLSEQEAQELMREVSENSADPEELLRNRGR